MAPPAPPKQAPMAPSLARQQSAVNEITGDSTTWQIYASIFTLFVPTFVARLAWIGMKTTDTALLGHSGTIFLTASSLSDFWTSMSGVFITDTVLGSMCGQAYGAKNYDMVGTWLQISMTVFSWVVIPVFLLWCATSPVLHYGLGTEKTVADYAGYYAIVSAFCLPARLISGKLTTFFTSQKITGPSSQTTPLALLLNLAFGLQFVLGIPYAGLSFGFWACPIVTTLVEWFLVVFLFVVYCGYYKYHEKCYGAKLREWNFFRDVFVAPLMASADSDRFTYYKQNIQPKVGEFLRLTVPATLALASDFWRMSAIGLLAGTLGNTEVAVFNASYRLAWMNLVIIGAFSSACVTQLGIALGTGDGHLSHKIRDLGIGTVLGFLLVTTAATVIFVKPLAEIFSTDPKVIAEFEGSRMEMGLMIFCMSLSMHFESLLVALKKTETLFKASLISSWGGQVPGVLFLLYFSGKTLQNVYLGIGFGYAILLVLYALPVLRADLHEHAEKAFAENSASKPLTA
mmetsp:Transcript_660/g.1092  ORF Transcript_660/g.1092 Transcript_660/m.1092 type:complete len:514 (-) Transcript_660:68-1609(-)|eukprot:CAMPEP_0197693756 /NCGR_PEP_ID=MMETSP1338-20131121/112945_1 /TAXON_ID=43686 ORGANISM="Pelagodinium beii, Strain RCC1491" /NCGR_SAMPLE_ID=MMETSP1338 /ASSEMBLY_ACC=CAM_ASM_000754 /LENGTH=513 /DNA_ID=CAMNT_0043276541 /DNA_START=9 /DNA_END=1550 /DNA_ORIENTATION=-